MLGLAQEGERSGGNTLYALVAGEGTDEDLDTWRRAAAVAQSSQKESAREREARVHCTAPGHPGTGVIGEGEPRLYGGSPVWCCSALPERTRTGLLLGPWAVPFRVLFLLPFLFVLIHLFPFFFYFFMLFPFAFVLHRPQDTVSTLMEH